MIAARILEVKALKGPFELLLGARHSLFRLQPEAVALYRRLLATEKPLDDMVSAVLCVMVFATQRQGHIFAHNLNLCLEPEHADAKDTMQRIAKVTGQDTDDMFRKYCWEVMRLAPQVCFDLRSRSIARRNSDCQYYPPELRHHSTRYCSYLCHWSGRQ